MRIFLLFLLFLSTRAYTQYPYLPQNQQHYINGTIGEERGGRLRYHYGLDMAENNGTDAYAIENGIFNYVKGSCAIGHFAYVHVISHPAYLLDGVTNVNAGTYIGEVSSSHIHLQRSTNDLQNITSFEGTTPWINPIAGLNPTDNVAPIIDWCRLYSDGDHVTNITSNLLVYGKIDILLNTEDPRINEDGTGDGNGLAPFRMPWQLLRLDNNVIRNFPGISFANVPSNTSASTIHGPGSNYSTPNFEYWITQDPFNAPYNKYWNTLQKVGNTYDVSASYPFDTDLKDGLQFRIKVKSCDFSNNCADFILPNSNNYYTMDNFNPFIFGVVAVFSGGPDAGVYSRSWKPKTNGVIKLGLRTTRSIIDPVQPGSLIIYAISSEAMLNGTMKVRMPSPGNNIPAPFPNWVVGSKESNSTDGKELWKFEMSISDVNFIPNICYPIEFSGSDVVGNQILKYELSGTCTTQTPLTKTLPYRSGPSSWANPHAQGNDRVHFINLSPCGRSGPETEECTLAAEEVESSVIYASSEQLDGNISLSISGNHPDLTFKWTDANENVIATTQNMTNVSAGTYCVEIKEDCCIVSGCFEVGTCKTDVTPQLTHPTTDAPNTGVILLQMVGGEEPYTYQWANGQTSAQLSGLSVGTYCVTVTDANGCQVVACPQLIICPSIVVNPSVVIEKPSSCTAQDGWVRVLSWGVSPPATYDYVFQSENGQIFQSNGIGKYSGLASGIYTLLVTDQSSGCTGSYEVAVLSENYPSAIIETISPACEGTPNGKIEVEALDGFGGTYTFEWQNSEEGVVTEIDGLASQLSGIYEGNYCVTIRSDVGECIIEKCYDVPSVTPTSNFAVSGTVVHPCPESRNGSINLTVQGGVLPYIFNWDDINDPYLESEDRNSLSPGQYTITVTDYCGVSATLSFDLAPLEIESIVFTPGCKDEGSATIVVTGGNAPYTYQWKNGATTSTIQGLESGEYCVTVTDAGGCSVETCTKGINKEYTLIATTPCEGIAEGIITIKISNPGGGYVHVVMDGVSLYENTTTNAAFDLAIPSLTGDNTYNFDITIQDCVYPGNSVDLGTREIKRVFDHYNEDEGEDGACYWNNTCNDVVIPGSTVITNPDLDVYNGAGAFLIRCEVPIRCGREHVGDKRIKKRWVRAAEYRALLQYATDQGFYDLDYLQSLMIHFTAGGYRDCDKIRFCPANMKIVGNTTGFTHGSGSATQIDGTNCYKLNCGVFGTNSEDFCMDV